MHKDSASRNGITHEPLDWAMTISESEVSEHGFPDSDTKNMDGAGESSESNEDIANDSNDSLDWENIDTREEGSMPHYYCPDDIYDGSGRVDVRAVIDDLPARNRKEAQHIKHMRKLAQQGIAEGFDLLPRLLQNAGYREMPLPASYTGDLDNEIHPIFQRKHWFHENHFGPGDVAKDDVLWKRMQPSLRLATSFITNPNSLDWWGRLVLGDWKVDEDTGARYLGEVRSQGVEGIKTVAAMFRRLSKRVRFTFWDCPNVAAGVAHNDWKCFVDWCRKATPQMFAKVKDKRYPVPSRVQPVVVNNEFKITCCAKATQPRTLVWPCPLIGIWP